MNIDRALATPGWMSEVELEWLGERAAEQHIIVEVGTWRGRSARAMADNSDAVIYCVDTWADGAVGIPGWWETVIGPNWLWKEFEKNLEGLLHRRVYPLRMTSAQGAAKLGKYIKADMVFIDADHTFASVKQDIEMWRPILTEDGLLCGHDYEHPLCPEVKPAVDQLVPKFGLVDTIWYAV